ncbi:MAG: hypothetical protein L3J89_13225 [Gammaproteobacteria bacterium]|nr:hypothetical protein [Gammaproteobacteria bacterium]
MKIACVLNSNEITSEVELIVFPEAINKSEISRASNLYENSVVVGGVVENRNCRAFIQHRGLNRIDYLKVGTDGRTIGLDNINQIPVYEQKNICIGTLICMDIDIPDFSISVVERIRSSSAKVKILCVPADMGGEWLQGDILPFPKKYEGIYFILCNNIETHQIRCKSFIADTSGKKIVIQNGVEPLFAQIP